MKKKLPQCLLDKQESERAATVASVEKAVIELESQGYSARIKDIMFVTGLSRSVFSKPHIRRILIEYGIVEPKIPHGVHKTGGSPMRHKAQLVDKDGYIDRLLLENEKLKQEVEILRGEIHLLMHKKAIEDSNNF
jgi:hypothetical protein